MTGGEHGGCNVSPDVYSRVVPVAEPRIATPMIRASRELGRDAGLLEFGGKVKYVYNPLDYARAANEQYITRYARRTGVVLLMGMNPGPWGMAQTGIPFGEVNAVKDWLHIDAPIGRPAHEHPKRPVLGLDCARSEVSGQRLWGWAKERFGTPERFFDRFFVWNYCPLSFMVESGANLTPDKLSKDERAALYQICDRALSRIVKALAASRIIGVGKFAEARAQAVVGEREDLPVSTILHPSPASPVANRGWVAHIEAQLEDMGVRLP